MLHTISWQQYLIAIILCSAAWYTYVGLRFYQIELRAWLKIQSNSKSFIPAVANHSTAVIGNIKQDADTQSRESQELIFGPTTSDDISDRTLPKGPTDDLLAEAQTLITAYEENDDKPGFLELLKILLNKYEVFADEISLPAIIPTLQKYAQTKLPFRLNDAEWPLTF